MKALIAMSGGVDSSVSALLMKEKGYECIGCMMKLYDNEDAGLCRTRTCCSLDDVQDARSVADRLGIPFYVLNFKDDFREKIISKFIKSYENGVTPNPCIDCNRYMKFDKLYDRAMEYGCEKIVTGHYARIERVKEGYLLKKAIDDTKDQSYVLYSMTQEQLKHTEFPIGELKKIQVRKIAKENSFINEDKPDSQDICFVPDGDYVGAIKRLSGKEYESGLIRDMEGNIRGHHDGIIRYTIGQRKGLRISSDRPLYVCNIDADNNEVIVGSNENLYSKEVHVKNVNWISPWLISDGMKVKTKIRYRQKEQSAILNLSIESDDEATIVFDEPQRAVTKGQAAVIYLGDIVLGGGIISHRVKY